MQMITKLTGRWLGALLLMACFVGTAQAQRTVTLTLNTSSIPDTTSIEDFIEVRGAANGVAPATLADGNMIDWSDVSTLEPANIGGDYWQVQFQIADTTELTFKFYSQEAADGLGEGWESDPNPTIPAGTGDTTLTVHFFEAQRPFKDFTENDKGEYDWRPYESKEDSIAVWFRVYGYTDEALSAGYDRTVEGLHIGVRGDSTMSGGTLNWGLTNVVLTPEGDQEGTSAYDTWSGVAYFPMSVVGNEQPYKFVVVDGETVGWEDTISDRTFTIPASDTTLHWDYFDGGSAVQGEDLRVTSTVLFGVDLSPLEAIGVYDRGRGDTLQVRGEFNGWGCDNPDTCLLQRVPGEDLFEAAIAITEFPGTARRYKYFIDFNDENFMTEFGEAPPSGWEEPISTTGSDRTFVFDGMSDEQTLDLQFFNDILPANIIPEGVSVDVTFSVRMDSALVSMASPFNPAGGDSVHIDFFDPIWEFTQGLPRDSDGEFEVYTGMVLEDDDQDGVYTGTFTINGPTYGAMQYFITYGQNGTYTPEPGLGLSGGNGRKRTRFIAPNSDGSWPATWELPEESYIVSGALPFEENPAVSVSVEPIDGELPTKIALEANYPNPFNPSTTIEYSINAAEQVSLKVFDMTGRLVTTLVDGMQPASTYRVTFDADNLASGVYLYRLEAASTTITKKMILIK